MSGAIARGIARGIGGAITRRRKGPFLDPYGPELLVGDPTALNANVVVSGGVATFTNANLNDAAYWDLPLEDNVTYRWSYRVVSITKGNAKCRVFGATAAHSSVGAARLTPGTYVEELITTGASTTTNRAQIHAGNATAGNNSFVVDSWSLKKKLIP